ncbi:hypothetical protein Sru01_18120 [Sphaerisporangium rufum]|uniref:Uncharacterized protein n=1 Tax=Sphaerisporangium rufum TaxID=1381558 RepID=A0A919V423_9ACTN|nr:hypothetical protein Sru01_18120 [Sphaerisporangium rufum]
MFIPVIRVVSGNRPENVTPGGPGRAPLSSTRVRAYYHGLDGAVHIGPAAAAPGRPTRPDPGAPRPAAPLRSTALTWVNVGEIAIVDRLNQLTVERSGVWWCAVEELGR